MGKAFAAQRGHQVAQRTRKAPNGGYQRPVSGDLPASEQTDGWVRTEIIQQPPERAGADLGVRVQEQHERCIRHLEASVVPIGKASILASLYADVRKLRFHQLSGPIA